MRLEHPAQAHILIVDDDQDRLQQYQEIFHKGGYPGVRTVANPLGLGSRRAHLALLESQLVQLGWEEMLDKMLRGPSGRFFPIIVALEGREQDVHLQALRAGAMDFILKPVHAGELLARVRKWLRLEQEMLAAGDPPWPPPDGEELASWMRRARVLVVDDQPMQLMYMQKFLAVEGFERVDALAEPTQLLEDLAQGSDLYDVVICDYHLPGVNGMELIRALKRSGPLPPYTLLITADRENDLPRLAVEAGADDFLFKPLDRNELVLRVRNLLRLRYLLTKPAAAA